MASKSVSERQGRGGSQLEPPNWACTLVTCYLGPGAVGDGLRKGGGFARRQESLVQPPGCCVRWQGVDGGVPEAPHAEERTTTPQTPHLPKFPPPLPPSPLLATRYGIQVSCFPACLPVFFPFPKVRAEECRLNPLSGGGMGGGGGGGGWYPPCPFQENRCQVPSGVLRRRASGFQADTDPPPGISPLSPGHFCFALARDQPAVFSLLSVAL